MIAGEKQVVPRAKLFFPVVALAFISLLTCLIGWQISLSEFHHFEQVAKEAGLELPSFCERYVEFEFIGWLISTGVLSWGSALLLGKDCSQAKLSWFIGSTVLAVFLWTTASFLAVYLLHLKFYRFM